MTPKQIIFLLFIFMLPIDGTEYLSFYIGPFHISILDLLLVLIFYLVFPEETLRGFKFHPFIQTLSVLFIMLAVISSISLVYIPVENISYDIKITLNFIEFLVLILLLSMMLKDIQYLKKVLAVLIVSVSLVNVLTLVKAFGSPIPGTVRMSSTIFGPFLIGTLAILEGYLSFSCLVLGTFPFLMVRGIFNRRTTRIILIALYIIASILAYSRSLWIALLVQMIVSLMLFQTLETRLNKKVAMGVVFACILMALGIFAEDLYTNLIKIRPGTVSLRVVGYFTGLDMALSNPRDFLFGTGKGRFFSVMEEEQVPHNFLLDLFISKGIIVIILMGLVFYIIVKKLVRIVRMSPGYEGEEKKKFAVLFLISLSGLFTEGMFSPLINSFIFWTMIAITCSFLSQYHEAIPVKEQSRA